MDNLFYRPAVIQVAVYVANFVRGMPVGYGLLINVDIYGDNFLCHIYRVRKSGSPEVRKIGGLKFLDKLTIQTILSPEGHPVYSKCLVLNYQHARNLKRYYNPTHQSYG